MIPTEFVIRSATPEDADFAAPLLASTMGTFGRELFGLGDEKRLIRVLHCFFTSPVNRMSYTVSYIAEVIGQRAGLLVAFPARELLHLSLGLRRPIFRAYSFREGLYFIRNGLRLLLEKGLSLRPEAPRDSFYIAHLATHEAYRRQGIATALIKFAETLAQAAHLNRLALIVATDNLTAQRLYERLGFTVLPTPKSHPYYLHMLKTLAERSAL
ncbi:MAG: GNAT family N-acetyltransferase [Thermanaerothrix sp.]|nr:GNAT family N-acetyltransferase [Thermanaerothrix sp.]